MARKQLRIGELINVGSLQGARVIADVVRTAGYTGDELYVIECRGQLYAYARQHGTVTRVTYDQAVVLPKEYKAKQQARARAESAFHAARTLDEKAAAFCAMTA